MRKRAAAHPYYRVLSKRREALAGELIIGGFDTYDAEEMGKIKANMENLLKSFKSEDARETFMRQAREADAAMQAARARRGNVGGGVK
jgi:hydrogenase maturation factor